LVFLPVLTKPLLHLQALSFEHLLGWDISSGQGSPPVVIFVAVVLVVVVKVVVIDF